MAVALLDLTRDYEMLQDEMERAVIGVLKHSKFILGPEVKELEERVAAKIDAGFGIGCASGSDALVLALHAVGVGTDDEVITSPFSFFASAGSISRLGAKPVFADIDPRTYNIDPARVEAAITPKTRAIMAVHIFGQMADMTALAEIARRRNIPLIEDAAQAIGARWDGQPVGKLADISCFSFFPSKNLGGAGDGGMCATDSADLADKLRVLRVHGSKPKYHHKLIGYNSRLDTLQAAFLLVKLPHLDKWTETRRGHAACYDRDLAGVGDLTLPTADKRAYHIYNQYTIATGRRDELEKHLKDNGIGCAIYYPVPLHLQECYEFLGYVRGSLPIAESASERVISIPIAPEMTDDEQGEVVDVVRRFFS